MPEGRPVAFCRWSYLSETPFLNILALCLPKHGRGLVDWLWFEVRRV
jgi:hypothetical protein